MSFNRSLKSVQCVLCPLSFPNAEAKMHSRDKVPADWIDDRQELDGS